MDLLEFRHDGSCQYVDPEIFFPERGASAKPAKAICGGCSVKDRCLRYAIEHSEGGIWGGTTESERRALSTFRPEPVAAS